MNIAFERNGKVERHLLCERAYAELKNAVVNGWFKADERLVETKLAGIMGISRTPLREAIHKLEREGFLYKLPTGGHAVNSASEEDIRETQGVAGILLGYAVYLATSNAVENDLNLLRRIVRQAESQLARGSRQGFMKACDRFCANILLLSGNNRLNFLFEALKDRTFGQLSRLCDLQQHALLDDQRALIDLMEERQAARAEKLARGILSRSDGASEESRNLSRNAGLGRRGLMPVR